MDQGVSNAELLLGRRDRLRQVASYVQLADALLERGLAALEQGDEAPAIADFTRVVDWFAGVDGLAWHVFAARHAIDIMTSVQFPEPDLRVTAFTRRHKRRSMREFRRAFVEGFVADARARHTFTVRAVRRFACWGEPMVLLLRNFDLIESSRVTTAPTMPRYRSEGLRRLGLRRWLVELYLNNYATGDIIQTLHPKAVGKPLISQLRKRTRLVHVVSTPSTAMEVDWHIEMLNSDMQLPLYLPSDGWQDSVRLLIGLAERIVVWAGGKTTGLLYELALLAELGRTADTVVLLEKSTAGLSAITGQQPGAPLTADDPLLVGFPVVLPTDALHGSPRASEIVNDIVDQMDAVMRMVPVDRIARVRARTGPLDTAGEALTRMAQ